jgi:hypothetical protein
MSKGESLSGKHDVDLEQTASKQNAGQSRVYDGAKHLGREGKDFQSPNRPKFLVRLSFCSAE